MTTPDRIEAQRRAALDEANRVRRRRAELKRELGEDRYLDLARDVLAAPDRDVAGMTVADVLKSCRGFGRVKVARLLRRATLNPSRTLESLSERERAIVEAELYTAGERRYSEDVRRHYRTTSPTTTEGAA